MSLMQTEHGLGDQFLHSAQLGQKLQGREFLNSRVIRGIEEMQDFLFPFLFRHSDSDHGLGVSVQEGRVGKVRMNGGIVLLHGKHKNKNKKKQTSGIVLGPPSRPGRTGDSPQLASIELSNSDTL